MFVNQNVNLRGLVTRTEFVHHLGELSERDGSRIVLVHLIKRVFHSTFHSGTHSELHDFVKQIGHDLQGQGHEENDRDGEIADQCFLLVSHHSVRSDSVYNRRDQHERLLCHKNLFQKFQKTRTICDFLVFLLKPLSQIKICLDSLVELIPITMMHRSCQSESSQTQSETQKHESLSSGKTLLLVDCTF